MCSGKERGAVLFSASISRDYAPMATERRGRGLRCLGSLCDSHHRARAHFFRPPAPQSRVGVQKTLPPWPTRPKDPRSGVSPGTPARRREGPTSPRRRTAVWRRLPTSPPPCRRSVAVSRHLSGPSVAVSRRQSGRQGAVNGRQRPSAGRQRPSTAVSGPSVPPMPSTRGRAVPSTAVNGRQRAVSRPLAKLVSNEKSPSAERQFPRCRRRGVARSRQWANGGSRVPTHWNPPRALPGGPSRGRCHRNRGHRHPAAPRTARRHPKRGATEHPQESLPNRKATAAKDPYGHGPPDSAEQSSNRKHRANPDAREAQTRRPRREWPRRPPECCQPPKAPTRRSEIQCRAQT